MAMLAAGCHTAVLLLCGTASCAAACALYMICVPEKEQLAQLQDSVCRIKPINSVHGKACRCVHAVACKLPSAGCLFLPGSIRALRGACTCSYCVVFFSGAPAGWRSCLHAAVVAPRGDGTAGSSFYNMLHNIVWCRSGDADVAVPPCRLSFQLISFALLHCTILRCLYARGCR